ncbi:MAG: PEP-utilizing enzyme, partial [Eggerthellaceae bacterium]|nr:PEP-utilizing enzyme [Eggerthellaceae bacterium]
ILQSRPITSISFKAIPNEWTTADFRDGGVSARACKTLMGSLYGLVFNHSFLDSLKAIKLLPARYSRSIYETFFARPYWCLTIEKECFAKLPGFVEREIDEDMGVVPTYEGDGVVTTMGVKSLWSSVLVLTAVSRYVKEMESRTEERKADLLRRFEKAEQLDLSGMTARELHQAWVDFITNDYYLSEYTYFSYIFCNMILSTLFKDKIKKYLPTNETMNLMIGLSDLSHMRPIYEMWDMSRRPYTEDEFRELVGKYRHHSQHELDISYPNWDEAPEVVAEMIRDFSRLEEKNNPRHLGELQKQKYTDTLAKVPRKLHKDVEQLRSFLWWREEFRDVSTRSYYLVRKLTCALGESWARAGVLEEADDVFFLTVDDIKEELHLKETARKNKLYYRSFLNFKNPNEIGSRHTAQKTSTGGVQVLKGVPCSGQTHTAAVRVVNDIHDADRLQEGDILVTRCTDPAWTAVFSRIGGVITETGGMLSHAAVVSREYGLPCILVVKNATDVLHDGDVITMDCDTGEIFIHPA